MLPSNDAIANNNFLQAQMSCEAWHRMWDCATAILFASRWSVWQVQFMFEAETERKCKETHTRFHLNKNVCEGEEGSKKKIRVSTEGKKCAVCPLLTERQFFYFLFLQVCHFEEWQFRVNPFSGPERNPQKKSFSSAKHKKSVVHVKKWKKNYSQSPLKKLLCIKFDMA